MVAFANAKRDIAIVAGARTPFAKAGTGLRNVHLTDLAKRAMQETLYRADWPFDRLDEGILGNGVMPTDASNPARVSALFAGIPQEAPGLTVQRDCASGIDSTAAGAERIPCRRGQAIRRGG